MNLSIADARDLSWWEYQALVHHHLPDEQADEVDAPDSDMVAARFAKLERMGLVTGSVH